MSNEGLVGEVLRAQELADNWSESKQKGGIWGGTAAGVKIEAGKDGALTLLEETERGKDFNQWVLN